MSKIKGSIAGAILVGAMTISTDGQNAIPATSPTPEATIKLSRLLAANVSSTSSPVSQENAAKAYSKLLEGERYLWRVKNARGRRNPAAQLENIRNARLALQDAVAANPRLAEAYTALAELAITAPPSDIDEAIELANLALKIKKDNFGARRILARLYTFKSGLGTRSLDITTSAKAVDEWKFVASLDPRYMEAWAFLAEFYERQDNHPERIAALEKWRSSASAIDTQFYRQMTGGRATLSPETATLKLGEAFLKAGKTQQAIEILAEVVADEPENANAIELLRDAIQSGKTADVEKAVSGLQQAVFANPDNGALVKLLAETYARTGRIGDAAKLLESSAASAAKTDKSLAAMHYVSLGEIYEKADKFADARSSYEKAITVRDLEASTELSDEARIFLGSIYERLIRLARTEDRASDVMAIIERSRKAFGPGDGFADRELITYYRDSGKRSEALKIISAQRAKLPLDEGLARQEATLMTELGKVDDAVMGYRKYMASRTEPVPAGTAQPLPLDLFSNLLFVSHLYAQGDRPKEAAETANQALSAARGAERRQIARLSVATALQMSGDFPGAEATLRDILKESPNNPIALNNLGYFLLERNERFEEALGLIKQAVDIDPTNPSYLDSLGWAHFKLGKNAEAELYLREAHRHDSSSVAINEHLGDVLAAQSKADQAKSHWRRSLNLATEPKEIDRLKKKLGDK
ncbi:MAG: tetratricopeptide repeat protein [Pyrinomonadaceae bacterium]